MYDFIKNKNLFSLSKLAHLLNLSFKSLYVNPPLKEYLGEPLYQNNDIFYEKNKVIRFLEDFTFYPDNFEKVNLCPLEDIFLRKKNAADLLKCDVKKLNNIKRHVSRKYHPLPYFKFNNIVRYRKSHLEKYRDLYAQKSAPPTAEYIFNSKCLFLQEKSQRRIRRFAKDMTNNYPNAACPIEIFSLGAQGILSDYKEGIQEAISELIFYYKLDKKKN